MAKQSATAAAQAMQRAEACDAKVMNLTGELNEFAQAMERSEKT